jgi:hypothetical protein
VRRDGITGLAPIERIPSRNGSLSYPLSPITNSGSSPSIRISAQVTSCRCPSVRCSLTGWPSPLTATWIFVLKPPRDLPNAWESCPLSRQPRVGGLGRSSNRAIGSIAPRRRRALRAVVPRPRDCTIGRIVYRPYSTARIGRANLAKERRSLQSRTLHSQTIDCPGPFFRGRQLCQVEGARSLSIVRPRLRVAASLCSSMRQMMRNYLLQTEKLLKWNVHTT